MVMIIFSLLVFCNVKVSFFLFFDPFVPFFWVLVINLFFIILYFFRFFIFLPLLFCWGGLGYIFGCDLISYGLILLSLWICVLMVLARGSIFRLSYFSGFFLFVVKGKGNPVTGPGGPTG
jgi:NADH-ubiquinone oxidoreductase chain 4